METHVKLWPHKSLPIKLFIITIKIPVSPTGKLKQLKH